MEFKIIKTAAGHDENELSRPYRSEVHGHMQPVAA
jgi:hypothetical protein